MDGIGSNRNGMGNEPQQWDKTYGKRSLPQNNGSYGVINSFDGGRNNAQTERMNSFGPPVQPYLPQKKGHKKGILIAVMSVAAILLLCVGFGWISHVSSPAYKLKKGFENMDKEWAQMRNPLTEKLGADEISRKMMEQGSHIDTQLDFTTDIYGIGEITLGIDTDFYKDVRRKELDARTGISIMNYEFMHFNLYGDEEELCFSIPELFMEDLYIETEDVAKQFNKSMWADPYLFGELEEDYSINLFPDTPDIETIHSWQELRESLGQYSDHLEECLQNAEIEEAGRGLYRVIFDPMDMNFLLRDLLQSCEDITGQDLYDILSCLQLVDMDEDISLLFELDGSNCIRKIILEAPVSILDHQIELEGELLFEGEKRSIDLIRGQFVLTNEDDEEIEIIWQVDQSLTSDGDTYKMEADVKCRVIDEEVNLKYKLYCDAQYDEFRVDLSMKDDWFVYVIEAEGRIDDIKPGQSYDLDLSDLSVTMDGERMFKVSGNIKMEPFHGEIKRSAEAETAFFEMTERDFDRILDRIDDKYGSLLDLMP